MSKEIIIRGEGLKKVYKDGDKEVLALSGVNISIREDEYLTIIGPSGAGKSTLIHILGGLDYPTEGDVFFEGKNLKELKSKEIFLLRNRKVGFVFQFYHLIKELTVLENIYLPYLLKRRSFREAKREAKNLAEKLGLAERLNFYPAQLSGGEQQKTAIARALINKPSVVFCDEPTGNLDRDSSENVRNILKDLNKEEGVTIVLVTHNFELAKDASRVLNIKEGRIIS
ncbi:MAG: ABC transporter ATP-binding protein [Candidatus Omnitrophica bacterium]|nr:ABC transporter ATP-binding protein [Candidatus Omnitrophota bacterium]